VNRHARRAAEARSDPWTLDEILGASAGFREKGREFFARDGYMTPVAFVFGTRPGKGVHVVSPDGGNGTPEEKDGLSSAIEHIARKHDAAAIAMAMEVWWLEKQFSSIEQATEFKQQRDSIADHPGHIEVLYFMLESHRGGTRAWRATIVREGDKARAGEWVELTYEAMRFEWRFSHLLSTTS
jgi:hypothetical protein